MCGIQKIGAWGQEAEQQIGQITAVKEQKADQVGERDQAGMEWGGKG